MFGIRASLGHARKSLQRSPRPLAGFRGHLTAGKDKDGTEGRRERGRIIPLHPTRNS